MKWVGGEDGGFLSTGLLIAFLGAIAALGINHMGHQMKNATFQAPPAVQTASAVPH